MQRFGADIVPTFVLIVTPLCDGADRTSGDALSTGFISKEEAILSEMAVFFFSRWQLQKGDDTSNSHSTPLGSDESIT